MKNIILCILLVTVCLLLEVQGTCLLDDREVSVGRYEINCSTYTCYPDGHYTQLICPEYRCAPGKQIGYREMDLTKSSPECCGGPICAD